MSLAAGFTTYHSLTLPGSCTDFRGQHVREDIELHSLAHDTMRQYPAPTEWNDGGVDALEDHDAEESRQKRPQQQRQQPSHGRETESGRHLPPHHGWFRSLFCRGQQQGQQQQRSTSSGNITPRPSIRVPADDGSLAAAIAQSLATLAASKHHNVQCRASETECSDQGGQSWATIVGSANSSGNNSYSSSNNINSNDDDDEERAPPRARQPPRQQRRQPQSGRSRPIPIPIRRPRSEFDDAFYSPEAVPWYLETTLVPGTEGEMIVRHEWKVFVQWQIRPGVRFADWCRRADWQEQEREEMEEMYRCGRRS